MNGFKIPASLLRDLVAPVIPHACTDEMLPMITTIRFETTPAGAVTAAATDRFTIGICRVEPARVDKVEDWRKPGEFKDVPVPGVDVTGVASFHISVRQVKQILANLKPNREPALDPVITFDLQDQAVIVTGELVEGYYAIPAKVRLELGLHDDKNYPKLMGLIEKTTTGKRENVVRGYNGKYLAKFAAAMRDAQPVEFHTYAKNGPTIVTCGTHFVGAIMPVRLESSNTPAVEPGGTLRAVWADVAPSLVKEAKAS